jgi:hypothetical protein
VPASRSQKVEKPTLGGTRFRQRKRNINVPLDHTSFADDVVAIFQDAAVDGADVESNLVRCGGLRAAWRSSFAKTLSGFPAGRLAGR